MRVIKSALLLPLFSVLLFGQFGSSNATKIRNKPVANPLTCNIGEAFVWDGTVMKCGAAAGGVPYSGATTTLDLGTHILKAGSIQTGDGTQSPALILPELLSNGAHDTRIYGADLQASSACIIWPVGASTSGQVAMDSNTTAVTTDGKTCRVFTWQAPVVPSFPRGRLSWTPGAVNNATCTSQTFPLLGAGIGDVIVPGFPVLPDGIFGTMAVSAIDTAEVRLCNLSGGTVTMGSALAFVGGLVR